MEYDSSNKDRSEFLSAEQCKFNGGQFMLLAVKTFIG